MSHLLFTLQQLLTSVFTRDQLHKAVQVSRLDNETKTGEMTKSVASNVSHKSALQILDDEIRFEDFSPEGFWIVGCMEPYKAMKSNHQLMMKDNKMIVSRLPSKDDSIKGKIVGISFYNVVPCKAGLRHRLDFYPHVEYYHDTGLLLQHVQNNLAYLYDKYGDNRVLSFSVILPKMYPKRVLYDTFKHLGLAELREVPSLCIVGKGLPFNVKPML